MFSKFISLKILYNQLISKLCASKFSRFKTFLKMFYFSNLEFILGYVDHFTFLLLFFFLFRMIFNGHIISIFCTY